MNSHQRRKARRARIITLADGTKVVIRNWTERSASDWIAEYGEPQPIEPNLLMPPEKE